MTIGNGVHFAIRKILYNLVYLRVQISTFAVLKEQLFHTLVTDGFQYGVLGSEKSYSYLVIELVKWFVKIKYPSGT